MITRNCKYCDKEFQAFESELRRGRKYCSFECYGKAMIRPPNVKCFVCGKEYHRKPYLKNKTKYCSRKCMNTANIEIIRKRQLTPKYREIASKTMKKNWMRKSFVKKHKLIIRKLNADPDFQQKRLAKLKIVNDDYEFQKKRLKACNKRPNWIEKKLNELLQTNFPNEWKYVGDGEVIIAGLNPDFINVNGKKQIIEMFGEYWHNNPKTTYNRTELGRKEIFGKYGYETLVIWAIELRNPEKVIEKIKQFTEV